MTFAKVKKRDGTECWTKVSGDLTEIPVRYRRAACIDGGSRFYGTIEKVLTLPNDVSEDLIRNDLPELVELEEYIDMSWIKVPPCMLLSHPDSKKIAKRIDEYYEDGRFNTKVIVYQDGTLKDGFTAYLVAKMFGMKYLPCLKQKG